MNTRAGGRSKRRVGLPAIREESHLQTSRIPVHIIPPGATLNQPPFRRSMVVQTLPDERRRKETLSKAHPVQKQQRNYDSVDQVVAEYLHFSRYSRVPPITYGFAPLVCPCCTERNRENFRLKEQRTRAPSLKPDFVAESGLGKPNRDQATDGARQPREPENPEDNSFVRGSPVQHQQQHDRLRQQHTLFGHDVTNRSSWMAYQPWPYAQIYLNPEFNRPHLVRSYEEDRKQHEDASRAYVIGRILDADGKFQQAMQKLDRTAKNGFDGDYRRY